MEHGERKKRNETRKGMNEKGKLSKKEKKISKKRQKLYYEIFKKAKCETNLTFVIFFPRIHNCSLIMR
jgi:hypothetical protein